MFLERSTTWHDLYINEKSSYQIFFIPHNFILYLFSRSIKLPFTIFLRFFSAILTTHVLHIWSILGTFLKKNAVCVCWRAEAQSGIKHFKRTSSVKLWFSYGNQSSSRIDSLVSYFRLYFHLYENSFALNQLMQSKFSTINNFIVPCELHLYQLSVRCTWHLGKMLDGAVFSSFWNFCNNPKSQAMSCMHYLFMN